VLSAAGDTEAWKVEPVGLTTCTPRPDAAELSVHEHLLDRLLQGSREPKAGLPRKCLATNVCLQNPHWRNMQNPYFLLDH
jgi:hypothetical protein